MGTVKLDANLKKMEVNGVGRRTKLLDDFRNRRRYWELKGEVEDRNRWKQFINQI